NAANAVDQTFRRPETFSRISTRLSTASSKRSVTVSPRVATIRPGYLLTSLSTWATDALEQLMTHWLAVSPKRSHSAGRSGALERFARTPIPWEKHASAKATA